jgi:hypothetical protein
MVWAVGSVKGPVAGCHTYYQVSSLPGIVARLLTFQTCWPVAGEVANGTALCVPCMHTHAFEQQVHELQLCLLQA